MGADKWGRPGQWPKGATCGEVRSADRWGRPVRERGRGTGEIVARRQAGPTSHRERERTGKRKERSGPMGGGRPKERRKSFSFKLNAINSNNSK